MPSPDPLSFLRKRLKVEIDRPLGSTHPKHEDIAYPVNYGFIPGTISGDGEEIDAYVLGVNEPVKEFEGICIAVIHRLNDNEDKLVVAPEGSSFSKADIEEATKFQEKFFESEITTL